MDEMKTGPGGNYDDIAFAESFDEKATRKAALNRAHTMAYFLSKFANITRDSLCLSVGCGTGAKEQFVTCDNLICLDLASEMIRIAAQKGYICVQGTAFSLPFAANTFDSVFAIDLSTLHYSEEMVNSTVAEMARVAKVGGTVCTITASAFSKKFFNLLLHGNTDYDPYMVKNSVIRKAFKSSNLHVTHHCNVISPKAHSIRRNILLTKLKLDFIGGWFICCGTKKDEDMLYR